jgi:oligosaccharyltransferase complex subunit beta
MLQVKKVSGHVLHRLIFFVQDDVIFTITIEEFKDGKWTAYNANDVQLEFVRIDPFVRLEQ